MSLLLDALKQAERNKSKREVGRAMLESGQRAAAQSRREPPLEGAQPAASTRQRAAQKLFDAKQFARPSIFNATAVIAAALVALLIALAAVYWWVMRPEMSAPALAPRVPAEAAVTASAPAPIAAKADDSAQTVVPEPATPAPAQVMAEVAKDEAELGSTAGASTPAARVAAQRERPATPRAARRARALAAAQARMASPRLGGMAGTDGKAIELKPSAPEQAPDGELAAAYAALLRGDLASAERGYEKARAADRFNVDAELGLATIAARKGDLAGAQDHYRRALELEPKNAVAIAGMAGISPAEDQETIRVAARESEIKNHLTGQPDSPHLHFALGNEFAQQGRWSEAQQAYFDAFSRDPDNPDYAYNVAVSLDQIGQSAAAAQYYEKALTLSQTRPGQFDRARVLARLSELRQARADARPETRAPRQ